MKKEGKKEGEKEKERKGKKKEKRKKRKTLSMNRSTYLVRRLNQTYLENISSNQLFWVIYFYHPYAFTTWYLVPDQLLV